MASLITGYEYDIFISYRQNDNKYDGWVTEFVANLNKELEATFKEKITVYFDANPHDGLLETHSVDGSLEHKLKCLIFIPILSRTYCDPKSFAWEHEFVAFVKSAKADRFGLNVNLHHGNVASRVLPIRIHDLDPEDSALVEHYIARIRSVDFIYHSPGVNRSLRPWDDDVIKNTKQPFYRDQINKVANAIDEIIRGLKNAEAADAKHRHSAEHVSSLPKQTENEKKKENKKKPVGSLQRRLPRSVKWVMILFLIAGTITLGAMWFTRQQKINRARLELVPAIQVLAEDFPVPNKAFEMATEAQQFIPDDSALIKLWSRVSTPFSLITDPPGASVFWKDYADLHGNWKEVGITPFENVRMPQDYVRLKVEKSGFDPVYYAGPEMYYSLALDTIRLATAGTLPDNMVRVQSRETPMLIVGLEHHRGKQVGEFLMDKYEVTNKEYKRFTESGGYANKSYWTQSFYSSGKLVPWEEAMKVFVDKTGKPGPSTWEVGSFPNGKENHPVSGISWYEAAAYATFAGKKLPTVFHWSVVAPTGRTMHIIPLSNYNSTSTVPVGSLDGMSSFGLYDIAGNVREWCWNESNVPGQRFILGGGFNDPTYSFNDAYTQHAMDRSVSNGLRCMKELPGDTTLSKLTARVDFNFRNYREEKPVDDKTFSFFKRQFSYDNSALHATVSPMADSGIWKIERITMDAAYNGEKMVLYLFLPKGHRPYQPIIFFPGSNVIFQKKLEDWDVRGLDFILKSGRALVFPVFKGTLERRDELISDLPEQTVFYKDHVIMWQKDLGRTIDYLETRPDIVAEKIGYLGQSWGGFMGGIMPAVEPRLKTLVLHGGGMVMDKTFPEVDQINFIPRVRQPVLMLNGKHDMFYPVETSQKPMFDLLGTPAKDKKILIYDAGHTVPRMDFIRESLSWYDKYLGPVRNESK